MQPMQPMQSMQHGSADVPLPTLQGPMQHAAFAMHGQGMQGMQGLQGLPSLVNQHIVEPAPMLFPPQHQMLGNGMMMGNGMMAGSMPSPNAGAGAGAGAAGLQGKGKEKTQLCTNFSSGGCRFGERCSFAHGAGELRGKS